MDKNTKYCATNDQVMIFAMGAVALLLLVVGVGIGSFIKEVSIRKLNYVVPRDVNEVRDVLP